MKVLIVHNTLWAHYKSIVFNEVARLAGQFESTVHVVQIARSELSRANLGRPEGLPESYSYELLFDDYIERIHFLPKARKLIRCMLAYQPDVINLTGYYDPAQLVLLLLARLKGIKVVMQTESTVIDLTRSGLKEIIKRRIIALCDGFFCFGTQSANYMLSLGARPNQILLKKNAVDNTQLNAIHQKALAKRDSCQRVLHLKPFNFIYVGRLIAIKNLSTLITAFHQARQQSNKPADWGLIFLGAGDQQPELQKLTNRLQLNEVVHFIDGQPWYKVPEYLALADVLVLPSLSEPWGLVVNEAMACGLPVIVSNRCGCAVDLVQPGRNGYLFDPKNPDQLAQCMIDFLNGHADHQVMGKISRELIAPFSPEIVAQEMWEGFETVNTSR